MYETPSSVVRFAALAALLGAPAILLAGCEAEAVELAQEIHAARGDCTAEGLRQSDEECVRMMERYAGMGTELVHTYIGGLKALDVALDRMPPPAFDTAGLGYAISPELRGGDPYGAGASPRFARGVSGPPLTPAAAPAFAQLPGMRPATQADARGRVQGDGARTLDRRRDNPVRPRVDSRWRDRDRLRGDRVGPRGSWRGYDRWRSGAFGFGASDWWGYGDAYRYLESGPEGYFNSGPYRYFYGGGPYGEYGGSAYAGAYGYGYPPADPYRYGYGYAREGWADPYGGYGWDDTYRSGGPYPYAGVPGSVDRYGYGYGYDPRDARYGYGQDPRDPYGYGDPRDPYGYELDPRDPYGYRSAPPYPDARYDGGYDDPAARGEGLGQSAAGERSPAEDWGFAEDGVPQEAAAPATAAPARPAPHRPGILLPPEERLRRPWLED